VAGLLLSAPRTGDIDRLLHGTPRAAGAGAKQQRAAARRSAANAGSVMLKTDARS